MDADVVSRVREAVGRSLYRTGVARSAEPLVVAVSGGADSLCLLDALVAVVPRAQERLFVGHVDHQLRQGSAADGEYVKRVALDLGVAGTVDTVNVKALAKAERRGIEEAARIGRYRSLRRLAAYLDADVVLTGHTRDDSVETIVLNFLRGTAGRGLSGISEVEQLSSWSFLQAQGPSVTALRLIRPLLQVGRAETAAYCDARGIHWLTDVSNDDPAFTRNRVRGHLMPILRTYNPSVDRAIARMAQVIGDEDAWLYEEAMRRWATLRPDPDVDFVLALAGWKRQPRPLQRRLVRLIASSLGHDEIGFDAVERALAVGTDDGPPRAELGGGLVVQRHRDDLIFERSGTERAGGNDDDAG